jgi:ParB-like chromosome segregation protein Spo0J
VETPPQFYKIRDLVLLSHLNPRAQLCEETIARYMESFDALPPVSIQEGTGVLVDGFHRVEAATRLGAEVIPVRMLDIPDEELHLYSGLANCSHGRALNRAERNRFMVRLVEEYGWTAEKVARTVGVSHSSVSLAVREHRYNQVLSERLGEDVQVINSSHVQALYRVGDEQRAQLLEAVAGKTDEEGRPRPLTGTELKNLVDRMEDPHTPAEELQKLLEDPLARPEVARRRAPAPVGEQDLSPAGRREVERRGPLSDGGSATLDQPDLRTELLSRTLGNEAVPDRSLGESDDLESESVEDTWDTADSAPPFALPDSPHHAGGSPASGSEPRAPAPLGLDAHTEWESQAPAGTAAVALLEADAEERDPAIPLREAERLLSDLCARVEDAELWEQLRAARDLVREASALLGC